MSADQKLCRYCWRPVFFQQLAGGAGRWELVIREYASPTFNCDARGDNAVLSQLPHVPVEHDSVDLVKLIEIAAASITEPGSASIRDTNASYDYGMVRLITEAAGLFREDEDYVYHAIIERAGVLRGPEFRAAAYKAGLTQPPASWGQDIGIGIAHAIRRRDRGLSWVTGTADAEQRERAWIKAGRLGHPFTEPGEVRCRICGCAEDGIQHDARYPKEGDLAR
jgi:hypothetical protein